MTWARTSRQSRGYGAEWDRLRKRILKRDAHLCQPCKRKDIYTEARAVDHIKAKAKGGTDAEGNLEATCNTCHQAKTVRDRGGRPRQVVGPDGWPVTRSGKGGGT